MIRSCHSVRSSGRYEKVTNVPRGGNQLSSALGDKIMTTTSLFWEIAIYTRSNYLQSVLCVGRAFSMTWRFFIEPGEESGPPSEFGKQTGRLDGQP